MRVAGLYVVRSVEPRGALLADGRAQPSRGSGPDPRTLITFDMNTSLRDTDVTVRAWPPVRYARHQLRAAASVRPAPPEHGEKRRCVSLNDITQIAGTTRSLSPTTSAASAPSALTAIGRGHVLESRLALAYVHAAPLREP